MGNDVFTVDFTEDDTYIDDSDPFGSSTVNESNSLRFGLGYGNITSTLRWNHLFNDKLFSNTTLTYSRYSFNTDLVTAISDSNFMFSDRWSLLSKHAMTPARDSKQAVWLPSWRIFRRRTGPKGLEIAEGSKVVDSQDLETILDPFRI